MSRKPIFNENPCGIDLLHRAISGKWKISILWTLKETKRFNQIQKLFPFVTQAILTKNLRELEQDGFIHREIYREVPPRVEYSLTELGHSFYPIIESMNEWAEVHYNELLASFKKYE